MGQGQATPAERHPGAETVLMLAHAQELCTKDPDQHAEVSNNLTHVAAETVIPELTLPGTMFSCQREAKKIISGTSL